MDFLVIVLFGFAIMWLLVVLPQRRRQRAHERLIAGLESGDEIVTAGGLYGTVRQIGGEELTVEVAPGVEVRVAKRAVAAVVPEKEPGRAPESAGEAGD